MTAKKKPNANPKNIKLPVKMTFTKSSPPNSVIQTSQTSTTINKYTDEHLSSEFYNNYFKNEIK